MRPCDRIEAGAEVPQLPAQTLPKVHLGTELRGLLWIRKRILLCRLLAKSQCKIYNRTVFKKCVSWRWKKTAKT